jgi:hypothetical protein
MFVQSDFHEYLGNKVVIQSVDRSVISNMGLLDWTLDAFYENSCH